MSDAVHLSTPSGNPACKTKEPGARLTSDPRLVTCKEHSCATKALVVAERRGVLMPVEQARKLLAECMEVDPARQIRDQAEAVRVYLRQQRASTEAQNNAAEIKLRAERRLGELLDPNEEKRGGSKSRGASLPDGISHSQSSRWQEVARVSPENFEGYIAETRAKGGEITTSGLRREHVTELRRMARVEKLAEIAKGNKPLPAGATAQRYPVIYADPPWKHDQGTTDPSRVVSNHYPPMDLEKICALKVAELATDDAVLFMWATNPLLLEALQVLKAWGFAYKSNFSWDKEIAGTGYWNRSQHELLLIATRGTPPLPPTDARVPSVQRFRRGEHSKKPDAFYDLIERMYPELPRIELFAREGRAGFAAWGNQAPGVLEGTA